MCFNLQNRDFFSFSFGNIVRNVKLSFNFVYLSDDNIYYTPNEFTTNFL